MGTAALATSLTDTLDSEMGKEYTACVPVYTPVDGSDNLPDTSFN